ncbi:MAG: CpsD/CapB family tyrosine-protein kinase [Anaerolineae bacterium]|nr:CpsD/CapB family tyrosine-protein kinase [Anaerolineae bacterium]
MKLLRKTKKKEESSDIDEMVLMKTADDNEVTRFPEDVVNQLRHMVTRLKYTDDLPKQISLVSAIRGEGVTYLTWALASIIANDLQASVCAVELNWWFPSNYFSSEDHDGIAAVLEKRKVLDDVVLKTQDTNFDFILAGEMAAHQRAIYARSDDLKRVIGQLRERYDYVLIDVPAILSTSDSIPLASLSESCCLVIRQGVTDIGSVQMALDDVAHLNMLGVIMNQVNLKTPSFILRMIPQS